MEVRKSGKLLEVQKTEDGSPVITISRSRSVGIPADEAASVSSDEAASVSSDEAASVVAGLVPATSRIAIP